MFWKAFHDLVRGAEKHSSGSNFGCEDMRNARAILFGNPEEKILLGRAKGSSDVVHVAQDDGQRRGSVNRVMDLRFPP